MRPAKKYETTKVVGIKLNHMYETILKQNSVMGFALIALRSFTRSYTERKKNNPTTHQSVQPDSGNAAPLTDKLWSLGRLVEVLRIYNGIHADCNDKTLSLVIQAEYVITAKGHNNQLGI